MKKMLAMLLIMIVPLLIFAGCGSDKDPSEIIQGYKDSQTYSDGEEGSKQEFGKYIYDESFDSKFQENEDYQKVSKNNIKEIKGYVKNFDSWAKLSTFSKDYDFGENHVTEGDCYTIVDKVVSNDSIGVRKQRTVYKMYSIYYYDIESHNLYHIFIDITS